MKKIDLTIFIMAIAAVLIGLIYALCNYFMDIVSLVGALGNLVFMLFLIGHMALLAPLFWVLMVPREIFRESLIYKTIDKHSVILSEVATLTFQGIIVVFVYFGFPMICSMLFNTTWDLQVAFDNNIYVLMNTPYGEM